MLFTAPMKQSMRVAYLILTMFSLAAQGSCQVRVSVMRLPKAEYLEGEPMRRINCKIRLDH